MKKENAQIRLKRIMNERRLRQVDILRMSEPWQKKLDIKISKNTLSQYINGKSSPDNHKATLLAKTLGVNEAWLLGYNVPRTDEEKFTTPLVETTIVKKTIETMQKLDDKHQENVLKFTKKQLQEQNQEIKKEKVIALDKKNSNNTDTDDDGIDWNEWVAFDGKPMTDHDKQVLKDYFGDELKD